MTLSELPFGHFNIFHRPGAEFTHSPRPYTPFFPSSSTAHSKILPTLLLQSGVWALCSWLGRLTPRILLDRCLHWPSSVGHGLRAHPLSSACGDREEKRSSALCRTSLDFPVLLGILVIGHGQSDLFIFKLAINDTIVSHVQFQVLARAAAHVD